MEINFGALAAATVAAFFISSLWYAAFGLRLARLSDAYAGTERTPGWVIPVVVGRSSVVAVATAGRPVIAHRRRRTDRRAHARRCSLGRLPASDPHRIGGS